MATDTTKIVRQSLGVIATINPVASLIKVVAEKAYDAFTSNDKIDDAQIEALSLQTKKSELEMRIAEAQARVAQELAIAQRIETAAEVEMEEFYEYSGSGKIGANVSDAGFSAGIGGEGRRVSKRIFRFKSLKDIDGAPFTPATEVIAPAEPS